MAQIYKYVQVSKTTRSEMLALQNKKWQRLLQYVNKNSPYYSAIIKNLALPLEQIRPQHFPVLTKKVIQEHFDQIVTDRRIQLKGIHQHVETKSPDQLYLNRYHILKTSGSSGQPGYFLASSNEVVSGIAPSVARGHVGIRRKKKKICMLGFPKSYASSSQTMSFCNRLWIARKMVDYFPITMEQPIEDIIQTLNKIQPHVVSGYAKILLLLADAQRLGKLKISPDSLESGGELLLNTDRKYLKDIFSCPVNNHYGSTEGFAMGICRDNENAIELFEDHLIFDIHETETHITNLDNYTMPLIRYQMRDQLIIKNAQLAQPFQKVEVGIGRSDEIPYFTTLENNKVTVHPLAFDPLMPQGVKSFSMSCDKPNSIKYNIYLDEKFRSEENHIKSETLEILHDFFQQKKLGHIEIAVDVADDYLLNPQSGKTQMWRNAVFSSTLS